VINAAKIGTTNLKNWRALINRKSDPAQATFDLLPGQTLGIDPANNEPLLFGAEEGPGVLVVGKSSPTGTGQGHFTTDRARIDGITITGADMGGGILASGYARFLEVSNNRIVSNYGTYGGGIRIGHTTLLDGANTLYGGYTDSQNGCLPNQSCALGVSIHNNWVAMNGSTEAGGGGGISIGNGADNYQIANNYICGNFSMADGGGIGHLGRSNGGKIVNNKVLFNQTFNQSLNSTGGGVFVGGLASLDASGLSPGTGNVTIDANLIQGNNAGAGAGGGVRLAQVNGLDVSAAPNNSNSWNQITLVNNMIVDNVAGYAGGGVSLVDALKVNADNNTIANNDSTATNQQAFANAGGTLSDPQPAGLVSHATSTALTSLMNPGQASNNRFSRPVLANDILWHNRSFCWAVTGPGPGQYGLFDANANGTCNTASPAGTSPVYVDLAVLGTANQGTFANKYVGAGVDKLNPDHSILSALLGTNGYQNNGNLAADPLFVSAYQNGSSKPAPIIPGYTTLIDTAATTDEGGNFIDIRYGPLTPWNCLALGGTNGQPSTQSNCPLYADYHIRTGSPAIDTGLSRTASNGVPTLDYDSTTRPATAIDIGADELGGGTGGGGGGGGVAFPALAGLDNFNRANANTLGASWQQLVALGSAGVRVNSNQASCTGLLCAAGANAYWNVGAALGARQAAAFTFANTTTNGDSLILKATGNYVLGAYQNMIRVRYSTGSGGQVIVETTTNNGLSYTTQGTLNAAFANGNTLTAMVDATGQVIVWKTAGATTTQVGTVQLPNNVLWTSGGGRVGLRLVNGARVDNFAGATVP
jgi:hypothetical protein